MAPHNHANPPQAMVYMILDDLDIAGCLDCEQLRSALVHWIHRHSNKTVFTPVVVDELESRPRWHKKVES